MRQAPILLLSALCCPLSALALVACSSGTGEKTPATIATVRPGATQEAKPTERPPAAPTLASAATAPISAPSAAPPTDIPAVPTEPPASTPGQPIISVPTSAPPAPEPTEPPRPATGGIVYPCEAGDCNCSDFPSHAEAQRVYNMHGGNNWSGLDSDGDEIACESLP